MAKTKKKGLYTVGYRVDGQPMVFEDVDIFDLPYGKFDADNPLCVVGDVDMGKSKGRSWPDFHNVLIGGVFDCSDFQITSDTVLPEYFDALVCKHSINDLGVLVGRLPADFLGGAKPTITVRPAILNNVKNDKDDALSYAHKFFAMYPDVVVTDGKQDLSEILIAIERANSASAAQSVAPVAQKKTPVQTVPSQTSEWLSSDELASQCVSASSVVASLDADQVARYVKMARSSRASLHLKTCEMLRASDGAKITCIHISEVQRVIDFIENAVAENADKVVAKGTASVPERSVVPSVVAAPVPKKHYVGNREVVTTDIKKYISKNVFGEIRGACGKNVSLLLSVLNDVNTINVMPTATDGNKVVYIQDGQLKTSPSLEFKNVNCLAQGFETKKSRQRIIWGISGDCFVCQKFFSSHDGRDKSYQNYIRNVSVDVSELDLSEFLYVPDLIAEYSAARDVIAPVESDVPVAPAVPEKTATPVVAERVVVPDVNVMPVSPKDTAEPVNPAVSVVPKRGRGRPRIIRVTHEQNKGPGATVSRVPPATMTLADGGADDVAPVTAAAPVAPVVPVVKPAVIQTVQIPSEPIVPNTASSNIMWQELASVSYRYEQRLLLLTGTQNVLIQQLAQESSTEKLMQTTRDLQYILEQKQECERAMAKMRQMNEALAELQKKLDEHKI